MHRLVPTFVTALLLAGAKLGAQQGVLKLTRHVVTERIDVFSGFTNGNVLAIRADTGTLIVDAQSAKRVNAVDSALTALGALRVVLVINTHYHGDHLEGNAYFRGKGARVLAHRNVPVQAVKDTVITSWEGWHRKPAAAEALPSAGFTDSTVIQFGGEEVRVYHAPNAHTDGDAIVWLPRANVVHMGDIFELDAPPFIDWWAGGSLAGMLAAIDRVLPMINDRTRVIPGHGPVSDRATLLSYRTMLATLQARVQDAIRAGRTFDQFVASRPTAEFDQRLGGARHGDRLTRLLYVGLVQGAAKRR
ncbi:MAG TPA: MBL fold metallo-hydrolase [Gemmatimonadaceae bacterium]|nr:MBL fold metallo-hydrolase [Gemmatimonadaceae bacterium]